MPRFRSQKAKVAARVEREAAGQQPAEAKRPARKTAAKRPARKKAAKKK